MPLRRGKKQNIIKLSNSVKHASTKSKRPQNLMPHFTHNILSNFLLFLIRESVQNEIHVKLFSIQIIWGLNILVLLLLLFQPLLLSWMGREETGGTTRVTFPLASGRKTWKQSRTTFRSMLDDAWSKPAARNNVRYRRATKF